MSLSTSYVQATSSPTKSGLLPAKTWLAQMLREGQKRRFSWIGTITPDMARAILEHNIGNRPIRAPRVQQHIARLHAGKFILTHQGAALAKNGQLNDGQHRFIAISEADISAELEVTFGCEREEFAVVDQGYARTSDNILSIQGFKHAAVLGSICRMLMVVEGTGRSATLAQEVSEYAVAHYCAHMESACCLGQTMGKITSPTAAAMAYYWIAIHSPSLTVKSDLDLFWKGMTTGESLTGPRLRLREWLIRKETIRSNGRDENFRRAAGIIDAWDAWKSGRKTIRTDWPHVTTLPKVTR